MTLDDHVSALHAAIANPEEGLPEPVFRLITRLTPMVNVDLLLRNQRGDTLLTWRDDDFYHGWHVPGGIVRVKERMADRIAAVARLELGAVVRPAAAPLAINEIITARNVRGHFISFLFECSIVEPPDPSRQSRGGPPCDGQWAWHARCPDDLISSHRIYAEYIGAGQ